MTFVDCTRVAASALLRYPLRTAMMLLATAIGVSAVLMLTSLGEAARRFVAGEFQSLGTHLLVVLPGKIETSGMGPGLMAGESPRDITLDDARALLRSPAVEKVAPLVVGAATVSHAGLERDITIMGATAELLEVRHWQVAIGKFLRQQDWDRASPECVIGHVIARELFAGQAAVGQWLRVGDRRCRVAGVLVEQGISVMVNVDELVIMPVSSAQQLLNVPGLFRVLVQSSDREAVLRAKRDIIAIMRERHRGIEDVTVITQDSVLATFDEIFGALTAALAGIASVSLVVAGVLIMNVMLVAVSQRTREIGLLKALGANRSEVTRLFITEAVILSMFGAIAGTGLGYAAVGLMQVLYPALDFRPPLWAVAGAFAVAVGCGLLFGILPARRAARLDPIAALAGR
ncbi:MAG: ABC transporter permease [Gammaproteobacteria bacterium]|nr:MAG: ABC transporter permease [Gammaproteobacteria bacterium]